MSRRDDRKKEIAALIEEGRQAALAGRHWQACPEQYQGTMNKGHWLHGHDQGTRELRGSVIGEDKITIDVECQMLNKPKPVAFAVFKGHRVIASLSEEQVREALAKFDKLKKERDSNH